MNNQNNKIAISKKRSHEPLFTLSRRAEMPKYKEYLIRAVAILTAVIVCGLVVGLMSGQNPVGVFKSLFKGALGLPGPKMMFYMKLDTLLKETAFLLGISVAITPAFKMRFWNTGAEGQVLMGALASIFIAEMYGRVLSRNVLLPIMLVASVLIGAIWAGIPGYFKAKWNTNETLFTLMMNYVAMQLVLLFIAVFVKSQSGVYKTSPESAWFPRIFLTLNSIKLSWSSIIPLFVAILITVFIYIYLKSSKQGYEISVVGESENTARYIGINVKKVILRTVLISGAICGLMGWVLACSGHSINTNTVKGYGFTAIMVSWMSKFNPIVMVFASLLICFLRCGTTGLAADQSLGDIVTGIIILFIISSEFFINYSVSCSFTRKREK